MTNAVSAGGGVAKITFGGQGGCITTAIGNEIHCWGNTQWTDIPSATAAAITAGGGPARLMVSSATFCATTDNDPNGKLTTTTSLLLAYY